MSEAVMQSSPLRNPAFRKLFSAQVIALVGTGLTTVALTLLAYDLAQENAGVVLGTALAFKMVAYVVFAPVVGGLAHRLPRKALLIALDLVRAGIVLIMPFVTAVWQIYLLIFLLNLFSAGFKPVFAATIPDVLPDEARLDYAGESRRFREAGGSLETLFLLALLVVFLVLAAQFESFVNPVVIMAAVPLAVTGALLGLVLTDNSLNVYSRLGIVILIGLAAKNGVLIVEFANQLRDRGLAFREAVVEAAAIRLRPVLMTSFCTAAGALPLLLSGGADAESRRPLGIVILSGVLVSTLLTLFVVPGLYALMARNTRSPGHIGHLIRKLRKTSDTPPQQDLQIDR